MRYPAARILLCPMILFLGVIGSMATGQYAGAEAVYIIPPAADSGAVLMYKSVHHNGARIMKPSCGPSMTPKVFVTPVRMLGRISDSTITPIAGVSAYAVDNNDGSWTVKGEVRTVASAVIEGQETISMVVELYCCTKDSCD